MRTTWVDSSTDVNRCTGRHLCPVGGAHRTFLRCRGQALDAWRADTKQRTCEALEVGGFLMIAVTAWLKHVEVLENRMKLETYRHKSS